MKTGGNPHWKKNSVHFVLDYKKQGIKPDVQSIAFWFLWIDMDFIVICCGGRGIPVIREGRAFSGVDAVIDKNMDILKTSGND